MISREFLHLLLKHWKLILILIVVMLVGSIIDGISLSSLPIVLRIIFNSEEPPQYFHHIEQLKFIDQWIANTFFEVSPTIAILRLSALILMLFFTKFLILYTKDLMVAYVEEKIIMNLRNDMFKHLLTLPVTFFRRHGEIISRFTNDTKLLKGALTEGLFDFVNSSIKAVVFIAIAFAMASRLMLIGIITIVPLGLFLGFISRRLRARWDRINEYMGQIANYINSVSRGIKVIKIFSSIEREVERFRRISRRYFVSALKLEALGKFAQQSSEFLVAIPIVLLLIYSSHLIFVEKSLSSDQFMVFLLVVISLISPVKRIFRSNNFIQQGVAAYHRCLEIMKLPPEPKGGDREFGGIERDIELKGVWFSYEESPVLEDINLKIPKGKRIAIVGPSGAGKSTLLEILAGLLRPDKGQITVDGKDLWEYDIYSYRRRISIVPQETYLFEGTIYENLTMGEEIPMEKVVEACKIANAHEFIEKLPGGYFYHLEEGGSNLSGGQKQRLAIARAILRNPEIILLDEPTSNLDAESEEKVKNALSKALKGKTSVIVTHRLSTAVDSDMIVVMDSGRIMDMGTHEDLMGRCRIYRNLVSLQSIEGSQP